MAQPGGVPEIPSDIPGVASMQNLEQVHGGLANIWAKLFELAEKTVWAQQGAEAALQANQQLNPRQASFEAWVRDLTSRTVMIGEHRWEEEEHEQQDALLCVEIRRRRGQVGRLVTQRLHDSGLREHELLQAVGLPA